MVEGAIYLGGDSDGFRGNEEVDRNLNEGGVDWSRKHSK